MTLLQFGLCAVNSNAIESIDWAPDDTLVLRMRSGRAISVRASARDRMFDVGAIYDNIEQKLVIASVDGRHERDGEPADVTITHHGDVDLVPHRLIPYTER